MSICIHTASLRGVRPQNEDEIEVVNNYGKKSRDAKPITFCAVYDGHGGGGISKALKLSRYFVHPMAEDIATTKSYERHVRGVYKSVQQRLIDMDVKANSMGSTALVTAVYDNGGKQMLKVINLGDCRAVMCNEYNIGVPLTKDHKPTSFEEKRRITMEGGVITQDAGDDARISGLSVSRCFGDLDCKYISQVPDMYDYNLKHAKFVIVACDGVWDVLSNQDAVDVILNAVAAQDGRISSEQHGNSSKNIAMTLAREALARGSQDNLSVIVMFFT